MSTSAAGPAFYSPDGKTLIKCPVTYEGAFVVPPGVTSIKDYAFSWCSKITSITIPDSVTSIGTCAFQGCTGLTDITIPDSVLSMGNSAFYNCVNLKKVLFGERSRLKGIGEYAFSGCSKLTDVYLPGSAASIRTSAFAYCVNLQSVFLPANIDFMDFDIFAGCQRNMQIYCEAEMEPKSWNRRWNAVTYRSSVQRFNVTYGVPRSWYDKFAAQQK